MTNGGTEFKSGFVAVMGRPNVGKSTLVNALIGQKVAAVSPRPQTTRRRQEGILTTANYQVIFIDTPGVHQPHTKLGESMNQEARSALEHCDLVLFMVDASQVPTEEDKLLSSMLHSYVKPEKVVLVLNKIDLVNPGNLAEVQSAFQLLIPEVKLELISAARGDHRDVLLQKIIDHMPAGEPFYPEEQVTDLFERDIAADLVREACLNNLRYEVPHGIVVAENKDGPTSGTVDSSNLLTELRGGQFVDIGEHEVHRHLEFIAVVAIIPLQIVDIAGYGLPDQHSVVFVRDPA